jgi:hypothetical protein
MATGSLNLWIHLVSVSIYALATGFVTLVSLPRARSQSDASSRLATIAAAMRIYDPLSIALLGFNLMTGAFGITNYKAALGPAFFSRMGVPLAWKLLFAFLLINLAAYIAFGIGHRLVSRVHWDEPLDASWVDSMLKRLQASMVLALLLLGVIVWIALGMTSFSASPAAG